MEWGPFCSARCANVKCHRNFTDELHLAANNQDVDNVTFEDFSVGCPVYEPISQPPANAH